jgi:hypothetical protein
MAITLKSKLARKWLGAFLVAVILPVGGYLLGRATDCSPGQIDGQCGMSTFFGSLFGTLAGAVVLVGMTLWVIIAAVTKQR